MMTTPEWEMDPDELRRVTIARLTEIKQSLDKDAERKERRRRRLRRLTFGLLGR
jgi:hypothetical protein